MKSLIIGKLSYDNILRLVEFPSDGDKFVINSSINTTNSFTSILSILLSKYGVNTYVNGIIGNDIYGTKIKQILANNKVDTNYLEISTDEKTNINHKIYNEKTNNFTVIEEKSINQEITKYKYEFIPDVIIFDNTDYNANMAAINNYTKANLIYFAEKVTKESSTYCAKSNYVISNIKFVSDLTGVINNLNKSKGIIELFQKYIDLYSSNLIIKMDNFDILYCINDEVRIIKNVNKNLKNKEYLYYSLLIYFLINTHDVENSIKYTNKIMLDSTSDLDMINNIPDFNIVSKYIINSDCNINSTNQTNEKVNPVDIANIEMPKNNEGDNEIEKL